MKLSLAFSTCPNDTFAFAPIIYKKIDTKGLDFDVHLGDVEELNKLAFENKTDITKISFHAFAYLSQNYQILSAGSALGRNNGPLLISQKKYTIDDIPHLKIAIPGRYTTAHLLLKIAFPYELNTVEMLFSDIVPAIKSGKIDAGLIIHETRFTYQKEGLSKIIDLGEFWESYTGLPVPLGGIIIKRSLDEQVKQKFDGILNESIVYSLKNPQDSLDFIKKYAQEIEDEVMYKHIELYVNDFTINLGKEGRKSIEKLYEIAMEKNLIPAINANIFV